MQTDLTYIHNMSVGVSDMNSLVGLSLDWHPISTFGFLCIVTSIISKETESCKEDIIGLAIVEYHITRCERRTFSTSEFWDDSFPSCQICVFCETASFK